MSAIDGLLEWRCTQPPIGIDEALALAAMGEIGLDNRVDRIDHLIRRNRRSNNASDRRLIVGRAAEGDLINLLSVFIGAEQADMAHMMVAAGVDTAGDIEIEGADRRLALGMGKPVGAPLR